MTTAQEEKEEIQNWFRIQQLPYEQTFKVQETVLIKTPPTIYKYLIGYYLLNNRGKRYLNKDKQLAHTFTTVVTTLRLPSFF